MSVVYYNENDPKAAAWLRELIFEGQIAWGDVDERSIEDVKPSELVGYAQCHFFAGIGGWSYALRLAGWPDDREVWTGSCPCQPFSAAGRQRGFEDPRHLWPAWFRLIRERTPPVVFGEQVASPAGLAWLDLVHADLEGSAYAVAAADLCAAGVGAPHIRQRLYWVAHHHHLGRVEHAQRDGEPIGDSEESASWLDTGGCRELRLAHAAGKRLEVLSEQQARRQRQAAERSGPACELGDASSSRGRRNPGAVPRAEGSVGWDVRSQSHIAVTSSWARCEWIPCRDGKSRPVEPGVKPLVDGLSGRVGLLRGYGNAIVPQVAAAFIEATGLA